MFKLRMIFIALFGLLHIQGFAMAAAGAGAGQAMQPMNDEDISEDIDEDIIVKNHEKHVKKVIEPCLAKAPDDKSRNIILDKYTHTLARDMSKVAALRLWLKSPGNPNNLSSEHFTMTSPLSDALQSRNEPGIKVLLADPRTIINSPKETEGNFLKVALRSAANSPHDAELFKKMIRLVLFLGVDPTKALEMELKTIPKYYADCPKECLTYLADYAKIDCYCSPEERKEFIKINMRRKNITFAFLMNREMCGKANKLRKKLPAATNIAQMRVAHEDNAPAQALENNGKAIAAAAQAPKFEWPSSAQVLRGQKKEANLLCK